MGLTDTPFFAVWIPSQGVLSPESRGQRALFERVHDSVWLAEELFETEPGAWLGISTQLTITTLSSPDSSSTSA